MATIGTIGLKDAKGKYKNFTISINDETNQYGQNIAIWEEQTKEERMAKKPRVYVGNGRVVWTNGQVSVAERQAEQVSSADDTADLPF
jgi:arginine decarboxylase-like protein|tara:strand:+ start:188 stop:451 length:264 start_codon:yes stop_codon:yes gene_type:complete